MILIIKMKYCIWCWEEHEQREKSRRVGEKEKGDANVLRKVNRKKRTVQRVSEDSIGKKGLVYKRNFIFCIRVYLPPKLIVSFSTLWLKSNSLIY